MGQYRLEYSKSARAACKGKKPCNGTKIEKGQLRFGTVVDMSTSHLTRRQYTHSSQHQLILDTLQMATLLSNGVTGDASLPSNLKISRRTSRRPTSSTALRT
ncbi:zf-PARP-domain-containing protein [Meredithblackwellia eburnea MCA 4105]